MNTTTIASASVLPDGRLAILVEAAEAQSFYGYLHNLGVQSTQPSPVIWRPRRVTRNAMGQLNVEEDVLECEMFAQGSREDFMKWMAGWITRRQT